MRFVRIPFPIPQVVSMTHVPSHIRPNSRPVLLILGILCIAMALRAPVTGVAPLIGMIREQLGLSSTAAGMLITLPLLAFAIVSLFAAGLARPARREAPVGNGPGDVWPGCAGRGVGYKIPFGK